jgi:hypothetical protein
MRTFCGRLRGTRAPVETASAISGAGSFSHTVGSLRNTTELEGSVLRQDPGATGRQALHDTASRARSLACTNFGSGSPGSGSAGPARPRRRPRSRALLSPAAESSASTGNPMDLAFWFSLTRGNPSWQAPSTPRMLTKCRRFHPNSQRLAMPRCDARRRSLEKHKRRRRAPLADSTPFLDVQLRATTRHNEVRFHPRSGS